MNMNNPYQENIENALEKYGRDIVAAVKDGKDGKPELHVHFHPSLIHVCSLIILAIVIIGKDHRTQLFNNPWMKALIGILLITIVLVPNILEYKKVKDNLLSLCNKQSD